MIATSLVVAAHVGEGTGLENIEIGVGFQIIHLAIVFISAGRSLRMERFWLQRGLEHCIGAKGPAEDIRFLAFSVPEPVRIAMHRDAMLQILIQIEHPPVGHLRCTPEAKFIEQMFGHLLDHLWCVV